MKKLILVSLLLFIPLVAGASFDSNLYYGLQNNNEVTELQEFLTDQKVYKGPITGNFYSLTLTGVKAFQQREGISPVAGYFGPLTRIRANELLSVNIEPSNQQAVQETGSTPSIPEPTKTTNDIVSSLQAQINLLMQQLAVLQAQQTTIQQIEQNTQQIVQNTCVPDWQCSTWTNCSDSQQQTRICEDINNCGKLDNKPLENQICQPSDISVVEINNLVYPNAQIDTGNDINLWQTIWNVENNDVLLNKISIRKIGSVKNNDLKNFRLYLNDIQIGDTIQNLNSNNYLDFNLSERLSVGPNVIKLIGDVMGGRSLTFSFSLRSIHENVKLIDTKYNINIFPLFTCLGLTPTSKINSGKIVLSKTPDSPTGAIINGTENATLAKYVLTAYGENIRIFWTISYNGLDPHDPNNTLFKNGHIIVDDSQEFFSWNPALILSQNQSVTIEVKGDINGSSSDSIQVKLRIESEGQSSLVHIQPVEVNGNVLAIITQQ